MKNYIKLINQETGAVSVLVFVTVLTFVAVLLGAYLTVTTLQKVQLESNIRIQQIYAKDVEQVDQIYQSLMSKDIHGPICDITYNNSDTSIIYRFTFNEPIKNFASENIKLYSANSLNPSFGNDITLSTSSPSYLLNLSSNKKYVISFDYKCIVDTQNFQIGTFSDTLTNLPSKTLIASTELQHEDYIFTINSIEEQFKILSSIQENNNIQLSNIKLLELFDSEEQKGEFKNIDDINFIQFAKYDKSSIYVIILENNICTDLNNNPNKEVVKIIKPNVL